jgi:hypothetical protein
LNKAIDQISQAINSASANEFLAKKDISLENLDEWAKIKGFESACNRASFLKQI